MQQSTAEFWAGDFGSAYTERNRVDWTKRERFWRGVIPPGVQTVLEVGCNAGWNLRAIRSACEIDGVGVDVNEKALLEAAGAGFECHRMAGSEIATRLGAKMFDLTFTAGVLIHVPPEELRSTMEAIVECSKRWIIAVEYAFPTEQMVPYRGNDDRLWRRPYGLLYEQMGLKREGFGFAGSRDGFDSCAWWRYSK